MRAVGTIARLCIVAICLFATSISRAQGDEPLRLAVSGVSHGHLNDVISRVNRGDFKIVGVYEKDDRMREHNGLSKYVDKSLFYSDLGKMLDETRPEVVVDYGSIYDHLATVEACAPRGIHVMVEKPLAMNMKHARKMEKLAKDNKIMLLTNYETSWYDTNHEAYRMVNDGEIGGVTRMMVYDGHQGPFEIRCGKDFTDWLTDPEKNGGGAIIDFGCYGANLATWILGGERPQSVYAVSNHQKPDKYSKVEDDATIIVQYGSMTLQLMPSWNWPMNRKDMYIYGSKGYVYQKNGKNMTLYKNGKESSVVSPVLEAPYNDSFYYLKAAVRGKIDVKPYDTGSLENNMLVVEILDAAIKSSKSGKPVKLK